MSYSRAVRRSVGHQLFFRPLLTVRLIPRRRPLFFRFRLVLLNLLLPLPASACPRVTFRFSFSQMLWIEDLDALASKLDEVEEEERRQEAEGNAGGKKKKDAKGRGGGKTWTQVSPLHRRQNVSFYL